MRPEGLNPRVFPSLVRPEPTARRTHQPVQPGSPQSLPTLDCAAVASEPRAGRRAAALDGLYSYSIAHPERVLTPSRHATRVRLGRRWARGNHGVRQTVVSSSGGYTGGSDSNPMTASGRGAANAGRSTTSRLCVPGPCPSAPPASVATDGVYSPPCGTHARPERRSRAGLGRRAR